MYANDILTIPINLAGVPAISIPCGFENDLPLGLQIIGKHFDEETIYRTAYAYEQATDFNSRTNSIWGLMPRTKPATAKQFPENLPSPKSCK